MQFKLADQSIHTWKVEKIGVIGPGIVGMPMAALLAHARIKINNNKPAEVLVVQRNSINSGWKVDSINSGRSVIGGIEPGLDPIVEEMVNEGTLKASHHVEDLYDADVVLVCVQTDKKGFGPDYGPMFGALNGLAKALQKKPEGKIPLIIFESTLAPSSMATLMYDHFKSYGLEDGKDILLGNSPNRVMPGRLVERVTNSDKIVAGLQPSTPEMIKLLYSHIVTKGTLYPTNSMTAEIVKTLENAYRDVRIAFSTEIVKYCDEHEIDFYKVRDKVNERIAQTDNASDDPNAVPSGGILIPMLGVGGHCLPKDGILLWWRRIDNKVDVSNSLILKSREINDDSPGKTIQLAEKYLGKLDGKKIALLGAAYRFNSEDTRNSPTLALAQLLQKKNCDVIIQDPYVKHNDQNLLHLNLDQVFTNDLSEAINEAEIIFMCTAHQDYYNLVSKFSQKSKLKGIVDACNIYHENDFNGTELKYCGIGRGTMEPDNEFIDFVQNSFNAVEKGTANEVLDLAEFFNSHYASSDFNKVDFRKVQELAKTCSTGCDISDAGKIEKVPEYKGFSSILTNCAKNATKPG
ncbi:nucleotide sugar dehydrogenase [Bacteroidota bacterium]